MKKIAVYILALAIVGWVLPSTSSAATKSDFALYDQEPTVADVSVQCGATNGGGNNPKSTSFVVYITMTNRGDLGGVNGFVRVAYQDGDFVDYAIPVNTTIQITLSAGETPAVDQIVTVTGTGGAVLVGQMSILAPQGKPNPNLFGQTVPPSIFCSTTPAP